MNDQEVVNVRMNGVSGRGSGGAEEVGEKLGGDVEGWRRTSLEQRVFVSSADVLRRSYNSSCICWTFDDGDDW